MKRAFMSELAIARTLIPSIAGVGLFIFVVLTLANASDGDSGMSAGACAASAMSPIIIMNSLAGYDNQNGWERYRATLPFSRKDIICARYLSIIVFSAVTACAAALLSIVSFPLFNSAGIPLTGQIVFEIAIASAASMLISLMMVFLAQPLFFRFGHMEALRLSVGLFAQSAAPSAPRFIEYAICNRRLKKLRWYPAYFFNETRRHSVTTALHSRPSSSWQPKRHRQHIEGEYFSEK